MEGGGYCTERGGSVLLYSDIGVFCLVLLGFICWLGFFPITMVCEAERINFVWNRDLVCACSRSSV